MQEPLVIIVDEHDQQTGTAGKLFAHEHALLHRAVSVFLINSKGEWLLQRRALDKYHSRGLWTNTCCTHPYPGESTADAASRRLYEEMGIKTDLRYLFSFIYKEKLDDTITEYEYDHVFTGTTDQEPVINTSEVHDWRYIKFEDLVNDVQSNENDYTYWFRKLYSRVYNSLNDLAL